jgi:hypothetical protein
MATTFRDESVIYLCTPLATMLAILNPHIRHCAHLTVKNVTPSIDVDFPGQPDGRILRSLEVEITNGSLWNWRLLNG